MKKSELIQIIREQVTKVLSETWIPKKGDKFKIDMGNGPEEVEVIGNISPKMSPTSFIMLRRKTGGAPYNLTLSKINKVKIDEATLNESLTDKAYKYHSNVINKLVYKLTHTNAFIMKHGDDIIVKYDGPINAYDNTRKVSIALKKIGYPNYRPDSTTIIIDMDNVVTPNHIKESKVLTEGNIETGVLRVERYNEDEVYYVEFFKNGLLLQLHPSLLKKYDSNFLDKLVGKTKKYEYEVWNHMKSVPQERYKVTKIL